MQGPIAQALALSSVANAFLRGKDVSGFWPDATVFRFSKSCDFRKLEGERDELIASDPMAWFETLRTSRGLQLHAAPRPRAPRQTVPINERQSVGFVGGGPAWIIEVVGARRSALWQGYDRLGDKNEPQHKIWLNTYLWSGASQPQSQARTSLTGAAHALDEALNEIGALAADIAPAWSETFASARAILNGDRPDIGYHADIAAYAGFTAQQRRILGAATLGWVFGGMGSWNDVGVADDRAGDYERVSEELFRTLIDAICALANSTFEN